MVASSLDEFLLKKLEERKEENSYRILRHDDSRIDFVSNDYLGLARSEELFTAIHTTLESRGLHKNGSTGSRLLSGNSEYYEEVEKKLAGIFNAEAALIFNSGYSANLAILSSLPHRGDTVIYDELAHACIKDGARLSLASRFSFKHNDLHDLEQKLIKATGKIFVAVESVYSMDGDACPLEELVALVEKYNAFVMIDEAHGTGIRGERGSGYAASLKLEKRIDVRMYTFGKGMGVHGACVVGSRPLIDYLINFARPFIYTTASSPHFVASIDCAFDYLAKNIQLQNILKQKIELFRNQSQNLRNKIDSTSAIQAIVIPGNERVRRVASDLQQQGFDVRPILSPTVPEGFERLRICLHVYNTDDEIKQLVHTIETNKHILQV